MILTKISNKLMQSETILSKSLFIILELTYLIIYTVLIFINSIIIHFILKSVKKGLAKLYNSPIDQEDRCCHDYTPEARARYNHQIEYIIIQQIVYRRFNICHDERVKCHFLCYRIYASSNGMGEWCDNIDVSIFDEHLDHVLVEHYHPFLNQIFHFLILLFILII